MSLRTVVPATRAGIDLVGAAADAAGETWANLGNDYAVVKNGSGSPITVTLNIRATAIDGALGAVTDPTVTIAAGVTKIIGPFPPGLYNDASGLAQITYSLETSVTVTILRCVS